MDSLCQPLSDLLAFLLEMDAKRLKFMYKYCPQYQKECNIKTYKDHKGKRKKTNSWLPQVLDSVTYEDEVDSDSSISLSSECSDPKDPLSFEPCSIEYTCNEESESSYC